MIRLGVHQLHQYRIRNTDGKPVSLLGPHLDYRLMRTRDPASPREIALFEDIARRIFLPSGIYRTTSPDRFHDLDEWAASILSSRLRRGEALDAQDWAASDCSTSAAWHARLTADYPNAALTATDIAFHLLEMTVGSSSFILDADLNPLQYVSPPFVILLRPFESRLLTVNWLLACRARAKFERLRRTHRLDCGTVSFPDGADTVHVGPLVLRKIPLLHPHAVTRLRETASFRVQCRSIFEASAQPVNVIRTMNILNRGYFDDSALTRAIRSVWDSLQPGGLWIVGRTVQEQPAVHHTSVLVKEPNGFRLLERYGEKSEIEDLALAVQIA